MGVTTGGAGLAAALGEVATEGGLDDLGQLLEFSGVVGERTGGLGGLPEDQVIAKTKLVHLGTDNCLRVIEFIGRVSKGTGRTVRTTTRRVKHTQTRFEY